jgi:membrane-associated protease RseP (regulator of RpoE activity)
MDLPQEQAPTKEAEPEMPKETRNLRLGTNHKVVFSQIKEDSLFANADLVPGQQVVSINGTPCPPKPKDVVDLIKAAKGDVTIVASFPVATAVKASQDSKVGIAPVPALSWSRLRRMACLLIPI